MSNPSTLSQYEKLKLMEVNILKNVGVTGVSVDSKTKGDAYGGSGKVRIYVEDINTASRVPETLFGQPVEVIVTGKLRTLPLIALQTSRTSHIRPAPGGVSIGHYAITAGTLSTRVFDSLGRKLILSNNHVLANSNNASIGDPILQPGAYDGGTIANDKIGTLERFIPVNPSGNIVDVALARPLNEADVADEVLDIGVVNDVEEAAIGMTVGKSGRTSGYTEATVTDISATVKISGYAGAEAVFEDQIFTSLLGKPGDSGSLVVNKATKKAVGLLFAGSDTVTCCNKFSHVMEYVHTGLGGGGIGVPGGVSPMAFLLPLGLGLVTTYPFIKR